MAECPNKETNLKNCTCSYIACSNRGMCCKCVAQHLRAGEIPGCFFSTAGEKSYNRSIANFIRDRG